MEGEKSDRESGSGALFEFIVIGDKTEPFETRVETKVVGGTEIATPQKSGLGGRLKGKARKGARLHKMSAAAASPAHTKPTEKEEARTSDRANVETEGSEAK